MKKSTVYTILAGLLLLIGTSAISGSFAVYFRAGLISSPARTIGLSLLLFAVAYLALWGMRAAQGVADRHAVAGRAKF